MCCIVLAWLHSLECVCSPFVFPPPSSSKVRHQLRLPGRHHLQSRLTYSYLSFKRWTTLHLSASRWIMCCSSEDCMSVNCWLFLRESQGKGNSHSSFETLCSRHSLPLCFTLYVSNWALLCWTHFSHIQHMQILQYMRTNSFVGKEEAVAVALEDEMTLLGRSKSFNWASRYQEMLKDS